MADKTEKKDELLELAQLMASGMNKFGEFLIQSAAEMREAIAAQDESEDGDEAEDGDEETAGEEVADEPQQDKPAGEVEKG